MKKVVIAFLIVSLITVSISAQTVNTFVKLLSYDTLAAAAACIAATPDGNYIVSGMVGGQWAMTSADGWIVKIDPLGDTIWTRRIGGNDLDMLGAIIVNDNKYIAVGFKGVFLSGRQGWLLEYDASGNKLVDRTYGGALNDALGDITPTNDENFLVLGQTKSYGTDSTADVWLVKLNNAFDTIWTKHFDLGAIVGDSALEDNGNGIMPFGNNKFLMTANSCMLCDGTDGIAWYATIDTSGQIIGSPHIFDKGPKNVFAGGIRPTTDGGAIITGATSMIDSVYSHVPPLPPFRSEDMWVLKLDANADTVWTKIYGQYGVYDGGFSIFQTSDGGYFMSAYSQIDCVQGVYDFDNVWMMKLNSGGDTTNVCRWGGPGNDDLLTVIPASDGGAIGVGCYNSNSNPLSGPIPGNCNYMIIKTDCNIVSEVSDLKRSEYEFDVYPNPVQNYLNIKLPYKDKNNLSVSIYNILGEKIASYCNFYTDNLIVPVASFPKGLYFIQLVVESKYLITKKIIIE